MNLETSCRQGGVIIHRGFTISGQDVRFPIFSTHHHLDRGLVVVHFPIIFLSRLHSLVD